eukprot:10233438-Alexandrium_andersonii.AAC.1
MSASLVGSEMCIRDRARRADEELGAEEVERLSKSPHVHHKWSWVSATALMSMRASLMAMVRCLGLSEVMAAAIQMSSTLTASCGQSLKL